MSGVVSLNNIFATTQFEASTEQSFKQLRGLGFTDGTNASTGAVLQVTEFATKTVGFNGDWTRIDEIKLLPKDPEVNSRFGSSVAINQDGNTAVVARADSNVYVFSRSGDSWIEQSKITHLNPVNEKFGFRVNISNDGNTIVIAIPDENTTANFSGAVSIYARNAGRLVFEHQQMLKAPTPVLYGRYGQACDISGDGNTIVVGSKNTGISYAAGEVYVYTKSGSTWSQQAILTASDAAGGDFFGVDVSISNDGNTVLVGADYEDTPHTRAGSSYVFKRSNSLWSEEGILRHNDPETDDRMGNSVHLSGDGNTAICGAYYEDGAGSQSNVSGREYSSGSAYVFVRSGTSWGQQAKLHHSDAFSTDYFGGSVSISDDGNTVLIGAIGIDSTGYDAGAAFIFTRSGTVWTEKSKIQPQDSVHADWSGFSVSITGDGSIALIGAPNKRSDRDGIYDSSGAAYIIKGGGSYGVGRLTGGYGGGGTLLKKTWSRYEDFFMRPSEIQPGDYFGSSSQISKHGEKFVVGSYYRDGQGLLGLTGPLLGSAYVFKRRSENIWTLDDVLRPPLNPSNPAHTVTPKYVNSTYTNDLYYGWDVAISDEGNDIVVSCIKGTSAGSTPTGGTSFPNAVDAGAVSVWRYFNNQWYHQDLLVADVKRTNANMGWSVDISGDGDTVIAGAPYSSHFSATRGACHIFRRTGNQYQGWVWILEDIFVPNAVYGNSGMLFGHSVSINTDGSVAIIGAPYANTPSTNSTGAAYIWVRDSSNQWSQQAKLTAHNAGAQDRFGSGWAGKAGVAISGDGNTAAVGAIEEDTTTSNSGMVYIYVRNGTSWDQQAILQSGDASQSDTRFGTQVSLTENGDRLMVSAWRYDEGTIYSAGAVYIFERSGYTWFQVTKLTARIQNNNDQFGTSSAISRSGEYAIIGSEGLDMAITPGEYPAAGSNGGSNAGGAYVYVAKGPEAAWGGTLALPPGNPFAPPVALTQYPPSALPLTGYIVTASGWISPGSISGDPITAFDFNTGYANGWYMDGPYYSNFFGSGYSGSNSLSGIPGEWIKLQLPSSISLDHIKMGRMLSSSVWSSIPLAYPKDYTILGSNDNSNWTTLKTVTNTSPPGYGQFEQQMVQSSTAFLWYAIVVTKNHGSVNQSQSRVGRGELQFYGTPGSGGSGGGGGGSSTRHPPTALPLSGYTVTASSVQFGWTPQRAFNGIIGNEGWHANQSYISASNYSHNGSQSLGGVSGEWIKMQFPSAMTLSYIKLAPRNDPNDPNSTQNPKDLTILGSNNNSTWYVITSVTGLTPASFGQFGQIAAQSNTNYLYYAVVVTRTGPGGGWLTIGEIEFWGI